MEEPKDYYYFKNYIVGKLNYKPSKKQYADWHAYEQFLINALKKK